MDWVTEFFLTEHKECFRSSSRCLVFCQCNFCVWSNIFSQVLSPDPSNVPSWPKLLCRPFLKSQSTHKKVLTSVNQLFYLEDMKDIYNPPTNWFNVFLFILVFTLCRNQQSRHNQWNYLFYNANKKMFFRIEFHD